MKHRKNSKIKVDAWSMVYNFVNPKPNFRENLSYVVGRVFKKKHSKIILNDTLSVFDKYLEFYKNYEKRICENNFPEHFTIHIKKNSIDFFWNTLETPTFVLEYNKVWLLIKQPTNCQTSYTRNFHYFESRKNILDDVFDRFSKETWKNTCADRPIYLTKEPKLSPI